MFNMTAILKKLKKEFFQAGGIRETIILETQNIL